MTGDRSWTDLSSATKEESISALLAELTVSLSQWGQRNCE